MYNKRLDTYIPMYVESLLFFMTGQLPVLFDGRLHVRHDRAHLCHSLEVRKNVSESLEGSELALWACVAELFSRVNVSAAVVSDTLVVKEKYWVWAFIETLIKQINLIGWVNRNIRLVVIIQDAFEYALSLWHKFIYALSYNGVLSGVRLKFEILNVWSLALYLRHHN